MMDGKARDRDSAEACGPMLSALANRSRLAILCRLGEDEMAVGAIARELGLSQSALSQHLAKLREADLVTGRRDRQTIYYSCNHPRLREFVTALDRLLCCRS